MVRSAAAAAMMLGRVACGLGLPAREAAAQDFRRLIFAAPGRQTDVSQKAQTYEAGVGIERLLGPAIGVEAEVSGLMFTDVNKAREGLGAGSVSIVGHVPNDTAFDVFGELGYTLLVRNFTSNMVKFGGGLNYWFRDDRALTIAFVGRKGPKDDPLPRFFEIRVGIAFR